MAEERKGLGSERGGQDGDVGSAGLTDKKVDARSGYFDSLRERLGQDVRGRRGQKKPAAAEPFTIDDHGEAECAEEPAKPAFVTYGEDGKPE